MDYDYAGIRRARRAAGLTQEDLAAKLGINRATISKYESGVIDLSLGQLQKIAKILSTTVYEMVNPNWCSIDTSDSFASDEEIQSKFLANCKKDNDSHRVRLDSAYKLLNADGQQKAAERVEELTEIPRYRATVAPQDPLAPSEGTDTTPPEKPAEGPPEDK